MEHDVNGVTDPFLQVRGLAGWPCVTHKYSAAVTANVLPTASAVVRTHTPILLYFISSTNESILVLLYYQQVKILRLLRLLGHLNAETVEVMSDVLAQVGYIEHISLREVVMMCRQGKGGVQIGCLLGVESVYFNLYYYASHTNDLTCKIYVTYFLLSGGN